MSGTSRRRHALAAWALLGAAVTTAVLAVMLPLVPVTVTQHVISWPEKAGQPVSTVVPLVPYRPLEFDAELPCHTMAALEGDRFTGGDKWASVLRTLPPDDQQATGAGLVVEARAGQVRISASGKEILAERRPSDRCSYRVLADRNGIVVLRDGSEMANHSELLPPQVSILETAAEAVPDALGPDASGLTVRLRTDTRFQSSPSTGKWLLIALHTACLIGCMSFTALRYRAKPVHSGRRFRLGMADLLVPTVLLGWAVIGPSYDDDGWYLRHALNLPNVGYLGNYYYSFNSPEIPFVVGQYLLGTWAKVSTAPLWLHLFTSTIGVLVWLLLRWFLHSALPDNLLRRKRFRSLPYVLALAFLLWWLPYLNTMRPEPTVCLGTALTLALCEFARRRQWLGLLAPAVAIAAVTTLSTATGIIAWGPVVAQLAWVWRSLKENSRRERIAFVAAVLASGSVALLIVFADARLSDLMETTKIHSWYWAVRPWYAELHRYDVLLQPGSAGNWAKRAPVLLTLLALLFVMLRFGARRHGGSPIDQVMRRLAGVLVLGLAGLTISPTKWEHHFAGLAVPAIALLALTCFATPVPARLRTATPAVLAVCLSIVAAAVIYNGPNAWHAFADWGQPFGDHVVLTDSAWWPNGIPPAYAEVMSTQSPRLESFKLSNMMLWTVIVIGCLLLARRGRGRRGTRWVALGAARFLIALQLSLVALLITVFVMAPASQAPAWSMTAGNLRSLTGSSCGLADELVVDGGTTVTGFLRGRPTYVDWPVALLYPCIPALPMTDGMAVPAGYRLVGADNMRHALSQQLNPNFSGTQVYQARIAEYERIPVTMRNGQDRAKWGSLDRVRYRYPLGRYTVSHGERDESALEEYPTMAQFDYAGAEKIPGNQ